MHMNNSKENVDSEKGNMTRRSQADTTLSNQVNYPPLVNADDILLKTLRSIKESLEKEAKVLNAALGE